MLNKKDLLPEDTIEGMPDEQIEAEFKLLTDFAEGNMDNLSRGVDNVPKEPSNDEINRPWPLI